MKLFVAGLLLYFISALVACNSRAASIVTVQEDVAGNVATCTSTLNYWPSKTAIAKSDNCAKLAGKQIALPTGLTFVMNQQVGYSVKCQIVSMVYAAPYTAVNTHLNKCAIDGLFADKFGP